MRAAPRVVPPLESRTVHAVFRSEALDLEPGLMYRVRARSERLALDSDDEMYLLVIR